MLPEYVKLGISELRSGRDIVSPCNVADELKTRLTKVYTSVNENLKSSRDRLKTSRDRLKISRDRMRQSYNKSIRLHRYTIGDKVWLRNKYYKPGENPKLAPRRSGPWSVSTQRRG